MLGPILLLCVATAVLAQLPHPCKTPESWEGREHTYDADRKRERWVKISYDETQRRVREIEEIRSPDQTEIIDLLFLHNENMMYAFDLKTKKCIKSSIDRPFFPYGVPPSANFTGTASVGAAGVPNEHLIINVFTGVQEGVEYYITTSSPDCIPITASHSLHPTSPNSTHIHEYREFFDVSIGLSDPGAFIPPSECLLL